MASPPIRHVIGLLNVEGIDASLDYISDSIYKRYCKWILSQPNLAQDWLQLVGMVNLTRLTLGLLEGVLTEPEIDQMLPYTVPINVFNMYEVVADNLAIGLAYYTPSDGNFEQRKSIVRAVSTATISRLRGAKSDSVQELINAQSAVVQVSAFQQSLSPAKHRAFAQAFIDKHRHSELNDIEYSLHPMLVANVETCNQVVSTLDGYLTQELVQKGFIKRYAGLNRLLDDTPISRDYLLQIGSNTIMVTPVLGYYIAIVAEEIRLIHNYEAVVENGLLLKALERTALLVRLLNDLGPELLAQSELEYAALCDRLREAQQLGRITSFRDLLLNFSAQSNVSLTRLMKDLQYGEFNLALYEPCRSSSTTEGIQAFYEQLCFLSDVYKTYWIRLKETLNSINFETRSTFIADIILRFIGFHEEMYRTSFDHPQGEFAV